MRIREQHKLLRTIPGFSGYMDDILDSVAKNGEATELTKAIDDILKTGGFQVKRWQSNGEWDHVNNEKDVKDINVLQGKQDEKGLGRVWNNKDDVLKYKVEVKANKTQQPKFTKRSILSQVARTYDPIASQRRIW